MSRLGNKMRSVLDGVLGASRKSLEKLGVIKAIPFTVVYEGKSIECDYPYPLNFNEKDKPLFHSEHSYKKYSTSSEEVFELKNVNVSYEGVVFRGLKTFTAALPHPVFKDKFGWLYLLGVKITKKKVKSPEKCILVYDHWSMANYYHWMVDSLPRIILAQRNAPDATILLPGNPPAFITDSLKFFSLEKVKYIKKEEYLNFECLYVQNYAAAPGHQHQDLMKEIGSLVLNNVSDKYDYKRIYVSRGKQRKRRVSNEADVLSIIGKFGFQVVYFEEHTLLEQIQLMKNAEILLSSHGANLTNMMFMPEKAVIFELIRDDKPNFCYWSMSNCMGKKYYYQLCSLQTADNVVVDIPKLEENLSKILSV